MIVYDKIIQSAELLQDPKFKEKVISLIKTSENLIEDQRIGYLRRELTSIVSDEKIQAPAPVRDVAHQALLLLAEFKPLNDVDPITLEPILDSERFFVSTGHQFSFKTLVKWHDQRNLRGDESFIRKKFYNPYTNEPFSERDVNNILDSITRLSRLIIAGKYALNVTGHLLLNAGKPFLVLTILSFYIPIILTKKICNIVINKVNPLLHQARDISRSSSSAFTFQHGRRSSLSLEVEQAQLVVPRP